MSAMVAINAVKFVEYKHEMTAISFELFIIIYCVTPCVTHNWPRGCE